MNILLVYPETPDTFYSFKNALKFIRKKSAEPPLGLITVAAMLPEAWNKRLIDMNVEKLRERDLIWADYVFLSGMDIHRKSFLEVVKRCNQLGTKIVAGGPMITTGYKSFLGIDHIVLGEAENILPELINDIELKQARKVYESSGYPSLKDTPPPMWSLLKMSKYASMNLQYSRGCPHDCEFCSITQLNGRKPRLKTKARFIGELQSLYEAGWRGGVFIVDDNFIGNSQMLKKEILPAMIEWGQERKFPFEYTAEVTIKLSDDNELMDLMAEAGFLYTFVGIETPNCDALLECGKYHNTGRDILESVKKMQRKGFIVSGGFIVGFDNDGPGIFEQQRSFISQSGIVTAMVGLLNAPTGTRLFERLGKEGRLLGKLSGDNMDGTLNFIPKMDYGMLVKGYKELLESIYSPKEYYNRIKVFLSEFERKIRLYQRTKFCDIVAFIKSIFIMGFFKKGRRYYWKLLFLGIFRYPRIFPVIMTMAVYGFHFRKVVETV